MFDTKNLSNVVVVPDDALVDLEVVVVDGAVVDDIEVVFVLDAVVDDDVEVVVALDGALVDDIEVDGDVWCLVLVRSQVQIFVPQFYSFSPLIRKTVLLSIN